MKKLIFLLTIVLALLPATQAFGQEIKVGNAKYVIENGTAALKEFKKAEGVVVVPSTIESSKGESYQVTAIKKNAFKGSKATEITLPESVSDLDEYAFSGAKLLQKVTLPAGVTTLPIYVFRDCKALEEVNLPGIKRIEGYSFVNCSGMKSINLPEGLEYIGPATFSDTGLESLTIPSSVVEIDEEALRWNANLATLELLPASTPIKIHCILEWTHLKKIIFGRDFQYVGSKWDGKSKPFNNNPWLEEVVISKGLTYLPDDLVDGCKNFTTLSVNSWEAEYKGLSKFKDKAQTFVNPDGDETSLNNLTSDLNKHKRERERAAYQAKIDSITDLDVLYSEYSKSSNPDFVFIIMDRALEVISDMSLEERKSNPTCAKMLGDFQNDYMYFNYIEDALACAELRLPLIDPVADGGYTTTMVVRCLTKLRRWDEAAKIFPKALALATENGKYAVPDELTAAGKAINEHGYSLSLTPKKVVAKKKGSSWNQETILGVAEILGDAYSRHVEQKRLKKMLQDDNIMLQDRKKK